MRQVRKQRFTLIEVCICIALLGMLTTFVSYLGYDAVKEFRTRNGRAAFRDHLILLHHKNALKENNLMLLIKQDGNITHTVAGGNTKELSLKREKNSYYTGNLFRDNEVYALEIIPHCIPKDRELTSWIAKHNCIHKFYKDTGD